MQTRLDADGPLDPQRRDAADAVLRRCVHCGFCNATCPTYALTGNELDGPRGRIYLMKQALETGEATRLTQRHLDRCLTCMACETTCPSGVRYHQLLDIGRTFVDERVRRPWREAMFRRLLRAFVSRPRLFGAAYGLARLVRVVLPEGLRARIPATVHRPAAAGGRSNRGRRARHDPGRAAAAGSSQRVVVLRGCVQPTLAPSTNRAAARVLARQGTQLREIRGAGCCGALHFHFGDRAHSLRLARRNVTRLARALDDGAAFVVSTASGCGAFLREYGDLLADDPRHAEAARRVSSSHRDISEVIDPEAIGTPAAPAAGTTAFHCPCTLQHAQGLGDRVPQILRAAGVTLAPVPGPSRCCGSAGAYALLQPEMADALGRQRAQQLEASGAERIVTANVGCQHHLGRFAGAPVAHWIEALAEALEAESATARSQPRVSR